MSRDRRIDYIEFASADLEGSRRFFADVFGWRFQDYGPDYVAFNDGRSDGGFYRVAALAEAVAAPLVVLYEDDLEAALQRVRAAGAQLVKPVFAFPGGRRFHFREPGGNVLAVWSERDA
jgi:uncharacterized protein